MTRQSLSEAWFSFRASSIKCSFRAQTWEWYSPCDITKDLACFLLHIACCISPTKELYWYCLANIQAYSPWTDITRKILHQAPLLHVSTFRVSTWCSSWFMWQDLLGLLPQWPYILLFVANPLYTHSVQLVCQKQSVHPTLVTWCQIVNYITVLITHFIFLFTFAAQDNSKALQMVILTNLTYIPSQYY